ncbi:hypothetical protein BG000_010115 [Podila horticola]|nr:hypothetical protein BG000_010115 [Podila horticola]
MTTQCKSFITTRRFKVAFRVDDPKKGQAIEYEAAVGNFKILHIAQIARRRLLTQDGVSVVEICLSGDQYTELDAKPTHPEVMMKNLYSDTLYRNVSFLFDDGTGTDLDMEPSRGTNGAHKLILAQWPYFKTMFESEFSESGPGTKQIRIRDTKAATFKKAIQFMYMGDLTKEDQLTTVFTDAFKNKEDVSWEVVYIVAHRYDLEGLCQLAKQSIIAGLTNENAVPFLFRSAYLYDELRAAVVKYSATSCASAIASKDFRSNYLTHPEFGVLLHELFIEK